MSPSGSPNRRRTKQKIGEVPRSAEQTDRPGDQQTILSWRYGLGGESPCALTDTAKRLGVSVATVERIEAKALERLGAVREIDALLEMT